MTEVAISDIIIDSDNQVRLEFSGPIDAKVTTIPELAADIEKNGLIHPIEVRKDEEGKLHLTVGRRRIEAFLLLKRDRIEASVKEISAKDAILHTISENIQARNYSAKEEALALKAAIAKGWTVSELAVKYAKDQSQIGEKKKWIESRLSLLNLDTKVQDLVHKRQLGVETAEGLKELPKPNQAAIARQIVEERDDRRQAEMRINREKERLEEEAKFREELEKSEFKKCPSCGKGAGAFAYRGSPWVRCTAQTYDAPDHVWNLKTGKTEAQLQRQQMVAERIQHPAKREKTVELSTGYDVPLPVLKEALLRQATAEILAYLKKHTPKKIIEFTIDEFWPRGKQGVEIRVRTYNTGATEQIDVDTPALGAVTLKAVSGGKSKIELGQEMFGASQNKVDAQHAKMRRTLNSLPEIVKYHRTHKHQKKL
jgi:ParB/RepB/Spo0J family partition protein